MFERTLASLEGIENYEEQHAFAMASGMSAVSIIAELAKPGDNVEDNKRCMVELQITFHE